MNQEKIEELNDKLEDLIGIKDNVQEAKESINFEWQSRSLTVSMARDIKQAFDLLDDIYEELDEEIEELENEIEELEELESNE